MACHTILLEEHRVYCVTLRQHRMQRNDFYRENRRFLKSFNMLGTETAVSIPDSVADNAEHGETWINKC